MIDEVVTTIKCQAKYCAENCL